MFSREGCFALAGSRALWGRPGANRVGWLSLDDGSFQELFACDTYANWVGTDGSVAIGTMKSQFVVLDPKKGKKPARYPGADHHHAALLRRGISSPRRRLTHLAQHMPHALDLAHDLAWRQRPRGTAAGASLARGKRHAPEQHMATANKRLHRAGSGARRDLHAMHMHIKATAPFAAPAHKAVPTKPTVGISTKGKSHEASSAPA